MSNYLIGVDDGHGMETAGKRTPPLKSKLVFRGKTYKKGEIIHENDLNENLMEKFIKRCKDLNIDTIQLAPGDSDVSLLARVKRANSNDLDILISFHANALEGDKWQSKANGLVVIHHENCQSKTKELANSVYKYLKDVDWNNNGGTKYGVRSDKDISGFSLYILKNTKAPAILIEYGFMDNWNDIKQMVDEEFQDKCVDATLKGVCEVLGVPYKSLEVATNINVSEGEFRVRILTEILNIRENPSVKYPIVGQVKKGDAYTIISETNNFGKLKSGAGWISLNSKYVEKL